MASRQEGAAAAARWLEVGAEHAGQRIDNFLIRELRGVPRSRIYRILRTGEVRVNAGRARAGYRLQPGDRVRIPPLRAAERLAPRPDEGLAARIAQAILYEDEAVLVLDKPAGVPVHAGSGYGYGVIEALRSVHPQGRALELVHRLDRDTSGCLLLAKGRAVLRALHRAWREGGVDKGYLLVVHGTWPAGLREVGEALARQGDRVVADPAGRRARTRFRVRERLPAATLLEAHPLTGRMHQIRVHAAAAGHPILGDRRYGERARDRALGVPRLCLHAAWLALAHPAGGRRLRVEAPLEGRLAAFLEALRQGRAG
ncbi:RluA family pseudouridine synthase [Inmirania thermothiophila]|nr:RluA family pseudouridine synthase [Inmirania thermothiophila]